MQSSNEQPINSFVIASNFFASKPSLQELLKLFFLLEFSYVLPVTPLMILPISWFYSLINNHIPRQDFIPVVLDNTLVVLILIFIFKFIAAYYHCKAHGYLIEYIAQKAGLKNIAFTDKNTKSYFYQWECSVQITSLALLLVISNIFMIFSAQSIILIILLLIFTMVVYIVRISAASATACLKGKSFLKSLDILMGKSTLKITIFSFFITVCNAISYFIPLKLLHTCFLDAEKIQISLLVFIPLYIILGTVLGVYIVSYSISFAYSQLKSDESFRTIDEATEERETKLMEVKIQ